MKNKPNARLHAYKKIEERAKALGTEKDNILSDIKNELENSYLGVTEFGIQSEMPMSLYDNRVFGKTLVTETRRDHPPEEVRSVGINALGRESLSEITKAQCRYYDDCLITVGQEMGDYCIKKVSESDWARIKCMTYVNNEWDRLKNGE